MRKNKTAEVIENFANKRMVAEEMSKRREDEIHEAIPECAEIDAELRATSMNILAIASSGENIEEKMAKLRERTDALRARRAALLKGAGYPEDYTAVRFECPKCSDTGYVGLNVCECLRRAVMLAEIEDSGIGSLVKTQTFDTFDLSYYDGEARKYAELNYKALKKFAEEFDPEKPKNYLLMGNTGLGKTHLSTSVAKAVIESGHSVVYDTIDNILADFVNERFARADEKTVTLEDIQNRYYKSDLLIIDDLGCESVNQFSVSCIYNLINTRINNRKSTIINTNLSYDELRGVYADRITSRLFGEFSPLVFKGRDIRQQKLGKK